LVLGGASPDQIAAGNQIMTRSTEQPNSRRLARLPLAATVVLVALLAGCSVTPQPPLDPYDCRNHSPAGDEALIEAVLNLYPCSFHDPELVANPERWSDEEFAGRDPSVLLVRVTRFGAVELDGVVCPVVRVFRVILGMHCPRGNTSLLILKGDKPIFWESAWFTEEVRVFPPSSVEFEGLNYRFNLADPEDLGLLKTKGLWGVYETVEGSIK
jgi:hypothetical protein